MSKVYTIVARVSKEQLDKVKQKAERAGMSVSDFIRFLALKTTIHVKIDTDV